MTQDKDQVPEEPSFSEAMSELERILRGVEAEETDIDVLGKELRRAAELLELCRGKIRRAETEVTQIVQSLERESDSAAEESGAAADDKDRDELPF